MEAVKTWKRSRQELPGVEGAERSEGDGGNWGGPRWPGGCGVRRSVASYNRATGKGMLAGRASEAAVVPIEPDGQHNHR
jgi:hypothetical protein